MSASIEVASSWRGGSATLRSSVMYGPSGRPVERLVDDLHRLVDLGQADLVAVVVVAHRADRDLEVEVVVGRVRRGLAQVPGIAGGAQQRPGHAEGEQRLSSDTAPMLRRRWRKISLRSRSAAYWSARRGMSLTNSRTFAAQPAGRPRRRRRPGCSACACAGRRSTRTGRGSALARESSTRTSRSRRGRARSFPARRGGT